MLSGRWQFIYLTVEEAAPQEFYFIIFSPETSQAIRPHVAQQRVASQQLSECVTTVSSHLCVASEAERWEWVKGGMVGRERKTAKMETRITEHLKWLDKSRGGESGSVCLSHLKEHWGECPTSRSLWTLSGRALVKLLLPCQDYVTTTRTFWGREKKKIPLRSSLMSTCSFYSIITPSSHISKQNYFSLNKLCQSVPLKAIFLFPPSLFLIPNGWKISAYRRLSR